MRLPRFRLVMVLALAGALAGCVATRQVPAASDPSAVRREIMDRLYFGRNIPRGGEVSDADWAGFLADVVTPRFPSGFTVLRSEGQWRGQSGVIVREAGFILEMTHADDEAAGRAV